MSRARRDILLAYFQVREARTLWLCDTFLWLWVCIVIGWDYMLLWTYEMVGNIIRCECIVDAGWTVAWSVNLAQATWSRLGETCREPTPARTRALARRRVLVLSEVLSRSGERRSPKRACVGVWGWVAAVAAQARDLTFGRGVGSLRRGRTLLSEYARNTHSPLSRSRLSEGLSLKRKDPSHLSEGLWPKRGLGERMCGYCLELLFGVLNTCLVVLLC